jgi:hypothetical protein
MRPVLRFSIALVLAAGTWSAACAQQGGPDGHDGHAMPASRMHLPTITFPAGASHVDLPFVERRNHIVVQATIGKSAPLSCTLDTGARGTVLFGDSALTGLGMTPMGEALIKGAGGNGAPTHGSLYQDVSIGLGGLVMSNSMLVTIPDSAVAKSPLRGDMAMGRGLWEQVVAEIDWDTHVVRLHDPAAWTYTGHGVSVPLTFDSGGQPYVKARVAISPDSAFDVTLVLDTGASHAVQLQPGSDPRIVMPAGAKREKIGLGASGQVWGAIGRAATFEIGGVTFRDVPVTYPDASLGLPESHTRQGNLGSGLLRRFHVILDYAHQRMILEPGPHVAEPIELPAYGTAY